jgi:O-acetyl-ADP-ribose deacetylase (regulator of RNase III)
MSIFVVLGDITQLNADAIVCSTSTALDKSGQCFQAFQYRFGQPFIGCYEQLRIRQQRDGRGRYCNVGDAFWIPAGNDSDRLRGIVVVAIIGGPETPDHKARAAVRGAVREARRALLADGPTRARKPKRLLVALPAVGHGDARYNRDDLLKLTQVMVETAADEANQPCAWDDGTPCQVDVAFVTFTPVAYRLFVDVRRHAKLEPRCPLEPRPEALLASVREGRCVLFVGAGLSIPAGLPDWNGLLEELAGQLNPPLKLGGASPVDFSVDLAQWYVEQQPDKHAALDRFIHQKFGDTGRKDRAPPIRPTLAHYFLGSLPVRLFLTTNYDDLLERTLQALRRDPETVWSAEHVTLTGHADRPCVVKLHGDASNGTKVVLTRDDFDGFFRDHPVIASFLEGLLLSQTFLFVGYDLRDPNTRQVYSRVAHFLRGSSQRAYSVVVREEDPTSQFYEKQWEEQRLVTLRMSGCNHEDRVHSSLCLFDWLARESCPAPSVLLMPDVRPEQLPPGLDKLLHLRTALEVVGVPLCQGIANLGPSPLPAEVQHLARLLELLTGLGWQYRDPAFRSRTALPFLWQKLAAVTWEPAERQRLLRKALAAAEDVETIEHIGEELRHLRDLRP